jgi:hypothetical protein
MAHPSSLTSSFTQTGISDFLEEAIGKAYLYISLNKVSATTKASTPDTVLTRNVLLAPQFAQTQPALMLHGNRGEAFACAASIGKL